MTNSLLLKMVIEIVDLPIDSMVIFPSVMLVYQRVSFDINGTSPLSARGFIVGTTQGVSTLERTRHNSDSGQCGLKLMVSGTLKCPLSAYPNGLTYRSHIHGTSVFDTLCSYITNDQTPPITIDRLKKQHIDMASNLRMWSAPHFLCILLFGRTLHQCDWYLIYIYIYNIHRLSCLYT